MRVAAQEYNFGKHSLLSKEQEQSLFEAYKKSKDSTTKTKIRNYLIEHNMRFVAICAISYVKSHGNKNKVPIPDVIGYGVEGLKIAIERFDHTRNLKFITFAVWYINLCIKRDMESNETLIRIPPYKYRKIQLAMKDDKAELTNEINMLLNMTQNTISLDKKYFPTSGETIKDLIIDEQTYVDPKLSLDIKRIREKINEAIQQYLDPREQYIIKSYYGIDTDNMTMTAIGEVLGITREAIRMAKEKALKKLKKTFLAEAIFSLYKDTENKLI